MALQGGETGSDPRDAPTDGNGSILRVDRLSAALTKARMSAVPTDQPASPRPDARIVADKPREATPDTARTVNTPSLIAARPQPPNHQEKKTQAKPAPQFVPEPAAEASRSGRKRVTLVAGVVLVAGLAAGAVWFGGRDLPETATTDAAPDLVAPTPVPTVQTPEVLPVKAAEAILPDIVQTRTAGGFALPPEPAADPTPDHPLSIARMDVSQAGSVPRLFSAHGGNPLVLATALPDPLPAYAELAPLSPAAPTGVSRVALYFTEGADQAMVDAARDRLAAQGIRADLVHAVPFEISRSNIRYYDDATADAAQQITRMIDGASLRDFTHYKPSPPAGLVEIWLGTASGL